MQKVDSVNKRLKENVQEAKEFLDSLKDANTMADAEDKAADIKLKLERNLEKWNEMLEENEDPEMEKAIDDCEESQFSAEDMLAELEVFILKHKERRQTELNEKSKRLEMEQKEKERQMEIEHREREKQIEIEATVRNKQIEEKLKLENLNLE